MRWCGLKHFVVHVADANMESKSTLAHIILNRGTVLVRHRDQKAETLTKFLIRMVNARHPTDDRCASDRLCSGSDLGGRRKIRVWLSPRRFSAFQPGGRDGDGAWVLQKPRG
jgi:hypothetical protein